MILQDKVALVTGGTSGIGRATAIAFGAAGAKVVFSDIRDGEAKETAALIRNTGAECLFVKSDVSSEADVQALVSLTLNGDPEWKFAQSKLLGYCTSKTALNMLTVQLAFELRDTHIKVNSADPGFTATDLNQHCGEQTLEQGAIEPVRLALLGNDGATGGFFGKDGELPW